MTVEETKQRLEGLLQQHEALQRGYERLERMQDQIESAGGFTLSDMPKNKSPLPDRKAALIAKKIDYETELAGFAEKLQNDCAALEADIKQLDNINERDVLIYRYVDFELWDDICFIFFGDSVDYEQKHESFSRRLRRYHKSAIEHLAQIWQH